MLTLIVDCGIFLPAVIRCGNGNSFNCAHPTWTFKNCSVCLLCRKKDANTKQDNRNNRGVLQFQAVLENGILCAKI